MLAFTEAPAELVDLDGRIYRYLLAGQVVRAEFPDRPAAGQASYAVQFLDDAKRLWQLNQDMHLEELAPLMLQHFPAWATGRHHPDQVRRNCERCRLTGHSVVRRRRLTR